MIKSYILWRSTVLFQKRIDACLMVMQESFMQNDRVAELASIFTFKWAQSKLCIVINQPPGALCNQVF